jgi:hypothetical protein
MIRLGEPFAFERTRKDPEELRFLPEVQAILLGVERGGFEEAVIRMLILIAEARTSVRRDRLERAAKVLSQDEPFASLGLERRAALIHEQSVIVEFEPDLAVKALPQLLPNIEERRRAIEVVEYIAGAIEEMESSTIRMVQRFNSVLGLPFVALFWAERGSAAQRHGGAARGAGQRHDRDRSGGRGAEGGPIAARGGEGGRA